MNDMKKVFIAARSFAQSDEAKAVLLSQGYELLFNPFDRPLTESELIEMLPGVDALVAGNDAITDRVIASVAHSLRIIAKHGVGYNTIDVAAAKQYNIPVTVTPGANSKSVADLTLGLILALARRIPQMDGSVRQNSWKRVTGNELDGKTLGIVGMGNIGGEVAKRAYGFDMKIVAYDVAPRQDFSDRYGVKYVSIAELLSQSDYISLHAPAIPETVGMINMETLRCMKPTACLINTSRGDLIVEDDLYQALSQKVIAGAALDTFVEEPLTNSKLFELDSVVLTPHAGGATHEAVARTGTMAAQEVVRVLSGQEPQFAVKV